MLTKKKLLIEYSKKRNIIRNRLKEFEYKSRRAHSDEHFLELCFCICTPQSKAVRVASVINKDNLDIIIRADISFLITLLKGNTRFHNNKARYIINARKFIPIIMNLPKDGLAARELLVKNIKGLGYKEASHFLRNIGYKKLCIIDRHIVELLFMLGVFKNQKPPSTAAQYLQMEQDINEFAKNINIDVDELDLLLWSIKTGHVFK
jgi:N-glycosylase/DNA lyase